jgi:hypothetical protein
MLGINSLQAFLCRNVLSIVLGTTEKTVRSHLLRKICYAKFFQRFWQLHFGNSWLPLERELGTRQGVQNYRNYRIMADAWGFRGTKSFDFWDILISLKKTVKNLISEPKISFGTVHILRQQTEGEGFGNADACWRRGRGGLNLADVSKLTWILTYSIKNLLCDTGVWLKMYLEFARSVYLGQLAWF